MLLSIVHLEKYEFNSEVEISMKFTKAFIGYLSLNNLKIGYKISLGFAIILFLMAWISTSALDNMSDVEDSVHTVINKNQPLVVTSLQLSNNLAQANSYLSTYMLSADVQHKTAYQKSILEVEKSLVTLKTIIPDSLKVTFTQIEKEIHDYHEIADKMITLPDNPRENFPSLAFANNYLNPIAQNNLTILSQMRLSEEEEDASESRKSLLLAIESLRYAWVTLMKDMWTYITVSNDSTLENLKLSQRRTLSALDVVAGMSELFTFEQEEGFPELSDNVEGYVKISAVIVSFQKGDRKRMDTHLIHEKLGPIHAKITKHLHELVSEGLATIKENSSYLIATVTDSQQTVGFLFKTGMAIGVFLALLISYMITRNLNSAVKAMRDVAKGDGDLTRRLNVNGTDEIAQLSLAFNEFVAKVAAMVSGVATSFNN